MPVTLKLTWPANPAGESIQRYEVLQSRDNGPFSQVGSPVVPLFELPNPIPGLYRFKVRAVNFVGTGPESNIAEGPGLPTAPGDIVIEVIVS